MKSVKLEMSGIVANKMYCKKSLLTLAVNQTLFSDNLAMAEGKSMNDLVDDVVRRYDVIHKYPGSN